MEHRTAMTIIPEDVRHPSRRSRMKLRLAFAGMVLSCVSMEVAVGQTPSLARFGSSVRKRPAPIPVQSKLSLSRRSRNAYQNPQKGALVRNCFELSLGTNTFANAAGPPDAFELLCYNGQPVGPTITVKRGSTFCIHLKNTLQPIGTASPATIVAFPPSINAEQPHDLCVTNLHTHGLHVSPDGKADNVFQAIAPGSDFTFEYVLDGKHPAGTFWYHPHRHGSVAYQVSNGLAGALIVEGSPGDEWHQAGHYDLEDIPEIKAASGDAHQKILVFQLYNYRIGAGNQSIGRIDATTIYNIAPTAYNCDAITLTSADPTTNPTGQATAINGVLNPTIQIAPGEVQRWRLIHGGWDLDRFLCFVDDSDAPAADLKFHEIAVDGLATGDVEEKCTVELAPGQRSDVLIRVPPDVPVNTVYHLKQFDVPGTAAPHSDPQEPLWLANIVITGAQQSMQLPDKHDPAVWAKLQKCRPFEDIPPGELTPPPGGHNFTLRFAANDGNANLPGGATPSYLINGKTFLHQPPLQIPIGTAQEWNLIAGKSNHPFHIHVNPFQIVGYKHPGTAVRPMNLWRDTLYIKEGEQYTIRSRFLDYVGDSVLHCHILDHEDQGMMMCLQFRDPKGKLQPVGPFCPQQQLKPVTSPAPALNLRDVTGRLTAMTGLRGRPVVVVFFLGIDCPHCTGELRKLLQQTRGLPGWETEIVAVSGETIDDIGRARKVLEYLPSDRFHLLVDDQKQAFRAFGCFANGSPLHGLFVIDASGMLRAAYSGHAPFAKPSEVIRAVQQLPVNTINQATRALTESNASKPGA
jgi:FtsP/CotA-like multicopper oxidase with cupredoxin domain/peroxiredoxin